MAARVRSRRKQFGLTVETLAAEAGVSRHTLMRIEKGVPVKDSSIIKVRKRLRIFTDQLVIRPISSPHFRVHRASETQWMVSVQKATYTRTETEGDLVHVDDIDERRRLGSLGFQPFFTAILRSELPDGVTGHALMELYGDSWEDRHYGEEFIYCLRGPVRMVIEGDECRLEAGDSLAFDARKPHQYCLVEPLGPTEEPKLILLVVASRPEDHAQDRPRGEAKERQQPPTK